MTTDNPVTGVRTVGIPVTDQDRALAFYTDRLGFEVRVDVEVPELGGRWIELAVGDGASLALEPARDDRAAGIKTGVRLGSADAEALHASLLEQDVRVGELLRWPGVPPMFTVTDPDGNEHSVSQEAVR